MGLLSGLINRATGTSRRGARGTSGVGTGTGAGTTGGSGLGRILGRLTRGGRRV